MPYKLIDAAQARWRTVKVPHSVALVRAGAAFCKGNCLNDPPTSRRYQHRVKQIQPERRSPETYDPQGLTYL